MSIRLRVDGDPHGVWDGVEQVALKSDGTVGITITRSAGTDAHGQSFVRDEEVVLNLTSSGRSSPVPFTSGVGFPNGSVTPAAFGALYIDTQPTGDGGGGIYIADGLTDADWVQVGGNSFSQVPGAGGFANQAAIANNGALGTVVLTDALASEGSGNALVYRTTGVDGEQQVWIYSGASGEHQTFLGLPNGTIKPAVTIDATNFPTADPHVAGLVWNNAGTLKVSSG